MKPTDEKIAAQAHEHIKANHPDCIGSAPLQILMYEKLHHAFVASANWAISQMQPEWVAVNSHADLPKDNEYYSIWRKGYSPEETVARLFYHNGFKAYCFVDNSLNIYSIGEVVTHYKPLSQPPKH